MGAEKQFVIELDGFEFHSGPSAFSYDRLRQNEIVTAGKIVLRFTYDSVRRRNAECGRQVVEALSTDPFLSRFIIAEPQYEVPAMDPDPAFALRPSPIGREATMKTYFDTIRFSLNHSTLRECQKEAFAALSKYYAEDGRNAACVMSVGAGKTVLGVAAALAFARERALVITPGNVIKGTFDKAFDHQSPGNGLYGLPGGPLIPGQKPPRVLTLDREEGAVRSVTSKRLREADIIITNFHSLGTGEDPDDLLSKLQPADIDLIVVDEAHIAAAESYARTFKHFSEARMLLMSACFQRLDGRPIEADVVYRYRLIDSIADGNAKNLRVRRFAADDEATTYEIVWPDGAREEIKGKEALLGIVSNERKIALITAKSTEPICQVMRAVAASLEKQSELLYPVKPRVLFSALGERHAEQIASIAEEHGIPCAHIHHSMTEARISSIRQRFESDSGDLRGIVQLKMLGQGYDFPPICVVVPMRPYGSFSEFYQFVGRGIRVINHPSLIGRVGAGEQYLDVIYHSEMGLDEHFDTIYLENDMDPVTHHEMPGAWTRAAAMGDPLGTTGRDVAGHPEMFVLFERGEIEERVVHDQDRVDQRKRERLEEALAQRYSVYAQSTNEPVTFEQFQEIVKGFG